MDRRDHTDQSSSLHGSSLQSGRWLQEIYVLEQELVELVTVSANTFDTLSNAVEIGRAEGDEESRNSLGMEPMAQLKSNVDKYLSLLDVRNCKYRLLYWNYPCI
jgi:hypothetical protein